MIADVRRNNLHQSILDTLSYAAIFAAGLTVADLRAQLHTQAIYSDHEIRKALSVLLAKERVKKMGSWITLASLPTSRQVLGERHAASVAKAAIALQRQRLFSWLPTIQAIALTGSVAAGSAYRDDDIDLMIITRPGTLWMTRLVVLGLLLPTGWLRRSQEHGQFKDLLCLNLWLTTDSLSMSQHTLYIAHEVMQARFIVDRGNCEEYLLRANPWVRRFLATGYAQRVSNHLYSEAAGNIFFTRLAGMLWWCDGIAFALQRWHMKDKQSREVVTREKAFFHPRDTNREIMLTYKKQRFQQ